MQVTHPAVLIAEPAPATELRDALPHDPRLRATVGHDQAIQIVQVLANLTTMTLIGLLDGAAWTYVAWCLWPGVLISAERALSLRPGKRRSGWIMAILTFHLVGLGWILFGAESFISAGRYFTGLFSLNQLVWLPRYLPPVLLAGALTLAIDLISANIIQPPSRIRHLWRPVLVTASVLILAGLTVLQALRGVALLPFVYGKF